MYINLYQIKLTLVPFFNIKPKFPDSHLHRIKLNYLK